MERRRPTSRVKRGDLPTLGRPTIARMGRITEGPGQQAASGAMGAEPGGSPTGRGTPGRGRRSWGVAAARRGGGAGRPAPRLEVDLVRGPDEAAAQGAEKLFLPGFDGLGEPARLLVLQGA